SKRYYAMSETLADFVGSGIRAGAVPILRTYMRDVEARFKSVDTERRKALDDLAAMTNAFHGQKELVARYSERISAGYLGSIGQNILITIGASCVGAGIPETLRTEQRSVGIILLV